jgi:protein pelota
MRLLSKTQKLDSGDAAEGLDTEAGVSLMAVEPEDMWHANNLINPGDFVKAHTVRKVTSESSTGSKTSDRVHVTLMIKVVKTFFDPIVSSLRVSGTVMNENDWVSLGQHHTLDLEINRAFTVWKAAGWDTVAQQTLQEALEDDKADALCALVMHEGLANICLITDFRTIVKQRIESTIPKKRSSAKETSGGMTAFFNKTLNSLLRAVDFSSPRPLLIASPGFVAQDFKAYIAEQGQKNMDKRLKQMAKDATVIHSSTGYVHSLNEILQSPEVKATLRDKKFAKETQAMDDFYEKLKRDDGRAWYGVKPVERAINEGAVGRGGGVLLVNNAFFRSLEIATRKKYVALVDKVKADGGDTRLLSSDHESGQRLDALGGIAAILTYPILDLDEDEEDDGDASDVGDPTDAPTII